MASSIRVLDSIINSIAINHSWKRLAGAWGMIPKLEGICDVCHTIRPLVENGYYGKVSLYIGWHIDVITRMPCEASQTPKWEPIV